jgi:hypothetical protein
MSQPGVTVNPASKISAKQWAALIQRNPHVPAAVRSHVRARGALITGPTAIAQPKDIIPLDWPEDLAAVFASNDWEITTAEERFELVRADKALQVSRTIRLDLQSGEAGPGFLVKAGPGETFWSPDTRPLNATYDFGNAAVLFGETFGSAAVDRKTRKDELSFKTQLSSGRALVFVVNRFVICGVRPRPDGVRPAANGAPGFQTQKTVVTSDDDLALTFLHELSGWPHAIICGPFSWPGRKRLAWAYLSLAASMALVGSYVGSCPSCCWRCFRCCCWPGCALASRRWPCCTGCGVRRVKRHCPPTTASCCSGRAFSATSCSASACSTACSSRRRWRRA